MMFLSALFALSVAAIVWDRLSVGPLSVYRVIQWPLVAIALLLLLQRRSLKIPLGSPVLWWLVGFVGVMIVSSFWALDLREGTVQLVRYLGYALTAITWALVLRNRWEERFWMYFSWFMLAVASAMALTVLTDFVGLTEFYRWYGQERPYVRQVGLLGEANYAALKLGVFLSLGLFLAGWYGRQRRWGLVCLIIGLALMVSAAIFLTGSRMGGLFLLLAWGAFGVKEHNWFLRLRMAFSLGMVGGVLALVSIALTPPQELEKGINYLVSRYGVLVEFLQTGEERFGAVRETSLRERLDVWTAGLQIFLDHPWVGVGLGNFPKIIGQYNPDYAGVYSHNTYLAVLVELGLLGLVFFGGLCVQMWWSLSKIVERSPLTFYLRLSIAILFVGFTFLFALEDKFFWGFLVPVALARDIPDP